MSVYLCMKAALTEPRLLEKSFDFMVASATYLTHVATSTNMEHLRPISFPLPEHGTQLLKSVPEYVAENAMEFMVFLKRFKDSMYEVGRESFFNGGVGLVLAWINREYYIYSSDKLFQYSREGYFGVYFPSCEAMK